MEIIIFIGRCIAVVLFVYSIYMFGLMFKNDEPVEPNVSRRIYAFLVLSFVGIFFPVILILLLILEFGFFKRYLFCREKNYKKTIVIGTEGSGMVRRFVKPIIMNEEPYDKDKDSTND